MPIILRSTNEAWKRAAQDLINHAEIIVLDVSEGSGAIQSEIDMISAADRWHNVIILTKEEIADTTNTEQIGQFSAKGAEVVVYKKSWIMALPRLIFGSFVTLLFLIYLFLLQYVVVVLIYRVAELPDSFLLLWIVVDVVLFFWMYIIFFVRPAIEKGALKTLSKKLRSA